MPKQTSRRQLVSNELLERAAALFAERGFAGTSLQDIADAMGISRPAIYHYVSNKEELLGTLVHDVLERPLAILEEGRKRSDLTEDDRIRLVLREIALNNARNTTRFRLLDRSEPHLPPQLADQHRKARHRVLDLLVGLIEDAAAAGKIRPLPARTTALALMGMVNWVAWWYRPGVDGPPEQAVDVLVDVAMSGLARADDRAVARGPRAALDLLKEDLAHLEQTLDAEGH